MKILVVTQYFWPEDFRINELVVGLSSRGHEVTVLTGLPNYPEGRFFRGYGWRGPWRDRYHGASVVRVPIVARGRARGLRLLLNYLSFAVFGSWGALARLRGPFDAIFVFEISPITVGIPAAVARWRWKAPIFFWVLDLWPETLSAIGVVRSRRALAAVSTLVRWIYARCHRILVQSKGFVREVARHGVPEHRIVYFPNWVETGYEGPAPERSGDIPALPDGFKVMFAGNIGEAQDFPAIIEAVERLRNDPVSWVIIGDGRMAQRATDEIVRRRLQDKVKFLGRYPPSAMPAFFSAADALLVSLRPDPIFSLTIPGKVQTYLAAGKPVLAMLDGEGARVVAEAQAGFVCRAGDSEGLAENVLRLAALSRTDRDRLGAQGRAYARRNFDREQLFDQLEGWIEAAVAQQRTEPLADSRDRGRDNAGKR